MNKHRALVILSVITAVIIIFSLYITSLASTYAGGEFEKAAAFEIAYYDLGLEGKIPGLLISKLVDEDRSHLELKWYGACKDGYTDSDDAVVIFNKITGLQKDLNASVGPKRTLTVNYMGNEIKMVNYLHIYFNGVDLSDTDSFRIVGTPMIIQADIIESFGTTNLIRVDDTTDVTVNIFEAADDCYVAVYQFDSEKYYRYDDEVDGIYMVSSSLDTLTKMIDNFRVVDATHVYDYFE